MRVCYKFKSLKNVFYLDLSGFNKFIRILYASYVEFMQSLVGYYHT